MANIISKIKASNTEHGIRAGYMYYGTTAGTESALTVTIKEDGGNTISIPELVKGMTFALTFHVIPSTSATLSVNGLTGKPIHYDNGLTGKQWVVGETYVFIYNGTAFVAISSYDDYTLTVTGSGNAITSISKNGRSITATKGSTFINSSEKGAVNGVATLDSSGKVPTAQLPSYVDDVLEYASQSNLPSTGETGKIYVLTENNKTYRWSGSGYVEISASLALGETSSTAYSGDKGKANAAAIVSLQSNKVDKVSGKGLSTNDYTTTEKNKLSGIAAGAEVNVQSDWNETSTTSDAYIKNKPNVITKTAGASGKFVKGDGSLDSSTYLKTITAQSGTNINKVGTPNVTASTSGNSTTLTFDYLKGATGAQGYQGYQGITGLQGTKGLQGTTGLQGTKGDKGDTGSQGYQGRTGTATQGYQGYQGITGLQGTKGLQGTTGLQGTAGKNGTNGTNGTNGSQGYQGYQGKTGTATQGYQGIKGDKGNTGDRGPQGYQGIKGDKGDTGSQGYQGRTGTATQGYQGYKGDTGGTGSQGYQGYQGTAGKNGTNGTNGTNGSQGYQGLRGLQGTSGTNGTNGSNGAAAGFGTPTASVDANVGTPSVTVTASGANTAKVFNFEFKNLKGNRGLQGTTGLQGTAGKNGTNGTNGTNGSQGYQGYQGKAGSITAITSSGSGNVVSSLSLSGSQATQTFTNCVPGSINGATILTLESDTITPKTPNGTSTSVGLPTNRYSAVFAEFGVFNQLCTFDGTNAPPIHVGSNVQPVYFEHGQVKACNMNLTGEVNQNAFSNITVGSTTIAADSKTDTLTLVAGNNITLTPDATNDKITIAATDNNTHRIIAFHDNNGNEVKAIYGTNPLIFKAGSGINYSDGGNNIINLSTTNFNTISFFNGSSLVANMVGNSNNRSIAFEAGTNISFATSNANRIVINSTASGGGSSTTIPQATTSVLGGITVGSTNAGEDVIQANSNGTIYPLQTPKSSSLGVVCVPTAGVLNDTYYQDSNPEFELIIGSVDNVLKHVESDRAICMLNVNQWDGKSSISTQLTVYNNDVPELILQFENRDKIPFLNSQVVVSQQDSIGMITVNIHLTPTNGFVIIPINGKLVK